MAPSVESKIISCVTGSLYNVVLDLRKESKTFRQWVALEISANTKESIYVPAGCANAFLTMDDNTIVHYYMGDSFRPNTYKGIRNNDTNSRDENLVVQHILTIRANQNMGTEARIHLLGRKVQPRLLACNPKQKGEALLRVRAPQQIFTSYSQS